MKNITNNTNFNNKEIENMKKVDFEKVKKEIGVYLEFYKAKGEDYLKEYVATKDYKGYTEQEDILLDSALESLCKRGSTEFLEGLLKIDVAFDLFNLYKKFEPIFPQDLKKEDFKCYLKIFGRQQDAHSEERWLVHSWVLYSYDFIETIVDAAIGDLEENLDYMEDRDSLIEDFLNCLADDIDCGTVFSANIKDNVLEHILRLVAEFDISDVGFDPEEFESVVWNKVKDSNSLVDYIYRKHEMFIYEATENILRNSY